MEEFEEQDSIPTHKKGAWRKIFKTLCKNKRNIPSLIVVVLFLATLDVSYPLLNRAALNQFFESTDPNRFNYVWVFIVLYISVAVLYGLAVFLYLRTAGKIEVSTSYELRKEAYQNLQNLPFSYFDKTAQGWIMARLTSDARKLSEIISWGLVDLMWGIISMIAILIILLVVNPILALIMLAIFPIVIGITYLINTKILKAYRQARAENSKLTAAYNEGFMGVKATKSLVIEDQNIGEFRNKAISYRRSSLRAVAFSALFGPIVFIICYISVGTTLYVGTLLAVSIPTLYMFVDYTLKFFDPVMNTAQILGDFQQAQASAERIISLIEEEPSIKDTPEVIEKYGTIFEPKYENFEPLLGDVEFKDVSFKYEKGEEVLKHFNLHVDAGMNVALVGHTGSGKSTIVNLICRFYEPTAGEILIDGKNYKDRSITWLHSNLGYVLQTPQLFSGSILDNVRYGNLKATDEECIQALKTVAADEFISKLENGYNTLVGEGGSKLSLGERQLISFARAIVNDPKLIILDEATSSIDTETESLIQHAVEVVLEGRTSFTIAHRLSTIVNSDLILVMKDGMVIESGTHHELLAQKGYYFELYRNQFTDDSINKLLES